MEGTVGRMGGGAEEAGARDRQSIKKHHVKNNPENIENKYNKEGNGTSRMGSYGRLAGEIVERPVGPDVSYGESTTGEFFL